MDRRYVNDAQYLTELLGAHARGDVLLRGKREEGGLILLETCSRSELEIERAAVDKANAPVAKRKVETETEAETEE